MKVNELEIYNFEFPDNVDEIKIGQYCFRRSSDYREKVKLLSSSYTRLSESPAEINTGTHIITAYMILSSKQKKAILPWVDMEIDPKSPKEYLDILLIVSFLTGRNVFAKTWDGDVQIIEDSRQHRGNFIRYAYPVGKAKNIKTGEIIDDSELHGKSSYIWKRFDKGLEDSVNKIWETIKREDWQKKYNNGAFLLIFSQSLRRQRTESAFILSWSIWEHIFSLHHSTWMTDKDVAKMDAAQKYRFIKHEYFQDDSAETDAEKIRTIRNRLIHFGFLPNNGDKNQSSRILKFFQDTEYMVAQILGIGLSKL